MADSAGREAMEPLGLERTTTDSCWRDQSSTAQGFSGLSGGSMLPVRSQEVDHDSIMEAAGGV
ncbi:hypothetical protein EMCG_08394 [[Emmonsia] crescens]|uniref:Uncharacterized protein n=1 Tax=[Emmonsia] crescens TaxID=73230 RepID=A0A0G2J4J0_9EURO|nr:hypothetical protein EMCG_08394 [Emmonsia crescens UAMH 3008]